MIRRAAGACDPSAKLKILMLSQFYPPMIGGEERHVRDAAIALKARGHDVSVATMWQSGEPAQSLDEGVEIFRLRGTFERRLSAAFSETGRPHAPPFPDPELTLELARLIKRLEPDIVHAHNWMLHSFLPLKRPNGPRLVVTLHDLSLVCATKTGLYEGAACAGPGNIKCFRCASRHYGAVKGAVTLLGNRASGFFERRLVDRFLPVSTAIAEMSGLPQGPAPYGIVPNFVRDGIADLKPTSFDAVNSLPEEPFILFVGDFRQMKGIDVLVAAYKRLEDAPPLVVIGRPRSGPAPEWPSKARVFEQWPHDAVIEAWSRCLFGVVPTIGPEACATVIMEAMAHGKPVVATRIGGNTDLIADGVDGLLVPPGDPIALAGALRTLIGDPDLRRRLSAGAKQNVSAFMASHVIPRIEAVYRSVLSERQHRRKQSSVRRHEEEERA